MDYFNQIITNSAYSTFNWIVEGNLYQMLGCRRPCRRPCRLPCRRPCRRPCHRPSDPHAWQTNCSFGSCRQTCPDYSIFDYLAWTLGWAGIWTSPAPAIMGQRQTRTGSIAVVVGRANSKEEEKRDRSCSHSHQWLAQAAIVVELRLGSQNQIQMIEAAATRAHHYLLPY